MGNATTIEINGPVVREKRKRLGVAVAELAAAADISRGYLAGIELGHRPRVSPKVYNALLAALGVEDYDALLAESVREAS